MPSGFFYKAGITLRGSVWCLKLRKENTVCFLWGTLNNQWCVCVSDSDTSIHQPRDSLYKTGVTTRNNCVLVGHIQCSVAGPCMGKM